MIDVVSSEAVRRLAAVQSERCITLQLPTHAVGPDRAQDPIRLKNLIGRANAELVALGLRASDASDLLRPASELIDDASFWARVEQGLAIFVTHDLVERFRLPAPIDEMSMVAPRFLIRPLLPFVADEHEYHLLALSENQVRLLHVAPDGVTEVDADQLPASLAEALRFDDRESQLHSHGGGSQSTGRVSAAFHGQGVATDYDEVDRGRFLRAVEAGLRPATAEHPLPLVLAGTEEIVAQFRNLSRHPRIVEGSVGGNPESRSAEELRDAASPLVSPDPSGDRRDWWQSLLATSTTQPIETVADAVVAATHGRVAHLLVADGVHRWGRFAADDGTVEEHRERQPGDGDLLNLAVIETIGHRGQVSTLDRGEMPVDGPVVAMTRF